MSVGPVINHGSHKPYHGGTTRAYEMHAGCRTELVLRVSKPQYRLRAVRLAQAHEAALQPPKLSHRFAIPSFQHHPDCCTIHTLQPSRARCCKRLDFIVNADLFSRGVESVRQVIYSRYKEVEARFLAYVQYNAKCNTLRSDRGSPFTWSFKSSTCGRQDPCMGAIHCEVTGGSPFIWSF